MLKKISIVLILFLTAFFAVQFPACADIQTGIGFQIYDNRIVLNSALVNYWFHNHFALNVNYNWRENILSSGIIYKSGPLARYVSPYNGLGVRDLIGVYGEEGFFPDKLEVVSGIALDLRQMIPGFSVEMEARLVPTSLLNPGENHKGFGPVLGVSFNFRIPAGSSPEKPETQFDETEIYLLAKLITAEAGDEPYEGQVAVGAVVLNRIKSPDFPDTMTGVINQPGQFSSLPKLHAITASKSCIQAAADALAGEDPTGGALYFYNPLTSSPEGLRFFTTANLRVTVKIGNHLFLK